MSRSPESRPLSADALIAESEALRAKAASAFAESERIRDTARGTHRDQAKVIEESRFLREYLYISRYRHLTRR